MNMTLEYEIEAFAIRYAETFGKQVHLLWEIDKDYWNGEPIGRVSTNFWDMLHSMIIDAPEAEALTSSLKYIREYRKYYEENLR